MLKKKSLWFYMFAFIVVIAACSETTTKNVEDTKSASNSDPSSVSDLDPSDPMTPYIKDGEKIFNETDTMLPEKVGNEMACMSCHADGGTSQGSTLVGVTGQYPKYQPRAGTVQTIEERINSCIVRSMNGEKLEYDWEEMRSIVAYLTHISDGIAVGWDVESEQEIQIIEEIPEPSVENGEELYEEKNCMSCHATDGSGKGVTSGPALWGAKSFSDGASLSRMKVMTNYIKNNMPEDDAGSLTDQEATDLAAFLLSKERPEWEGHENDWPEEERPNDVITKEERKKIQEGTFDWSKMNH